MAIHTLFVTRLYEAVLDDAKLLTALAASSRQLALDDAAGRRWCRENGYPGYTSYASLNDLPRRDPDFGALAKLLAGHVAAFVKACHMAPAKRLRLDSLWVNILKPGGGHSGHIHPQSVVSGTLYLALPQGAAGLRLEDPRLPMLMAAPPRTPDAPPESRSFVTLQPEPGTLYLWESWLRHEVPQARGNGERISISFNFGAG